MNMTMRVCTFVCLAAISAFSQQSNKPGMHDEPRFGSQKYVLSGDAYTEVGRGGEPVDCPPIGNHCKNLFYSTKPLSSPKGTIITAVDILLRKPGQNNHWYRCEVEASCGVAEFSDLEHHDQSCIGSSSCLVWRATDGARGEDTIRVSWRTRDYVSKDTIFSKAHQIR